MLFMLLQHIWFMNLLLLLFYISLFIININQ
jgi:hypothetical protein